MVSADLWVAIAASWSLLSALGVALLPHLADHRLPTVAEYCAPGFALEHHRADSDALACAHIVAQLQRSRGLHTLLPA